MLRRQVLQVYKKCLQSAAKCPEQTHRETMRYYVQLKFRANMRVRDRQAIQNLIADAQEELNQMEYYHSMYRASKTTNNSPREMPLAKECPHCHSIYPSITARFCGECGVQRPTI